MVYTLLFFSSKCSLFHDSNVFCSCIIHILYTGCAKIKKKVIPAPKGSGPTVQRIVTVTVGTYCCLPNISSEILVSNVGCLSSGHTTVYWRQQGCEDPRLFCEAKRAPRTERFGKHCSKVFTLIFGCKGQKAKEDNRALDVRHSTALLQLQQAIKFQADELVEICSMNGRDTANRHFVHSLDMGVTYICSYRWKGTFVLCLALQTQRSMQAVLYTALPICDRA